MSDGVVRNAYVAYDIHDYDPEYVNAAKCEICGQYGLEMSDIKDSLELDNKGVSINEFLRGCDLLWYLPDWESGNVASNVRRQVSFANRLNIMVEDGRVMTNKWW